MNTQMQVTDDELLVGVDAMAAAINQPVRRVRHWIARGQIKSVKKTGDWWTVGKVALRREFGLV
jgi:hypothetical protein